VDLVITLKLVNIVIIHSYYTMELVFLNVHLNSTILMEFVSHVQVLVKLVPMIVHVLPVLTN